MNSIKKTNEKIIVNESNKQYENTKPSGIKISLPLIALLIFAFKPILHYQGFAVITNLKQLPIFQVFFVSIIYNLKLR